VRYAQIDERGRIVAPPSQMAVRTHQHEPIGMKRSRIGGIDTTTFKEPDAGRRVDDAGNAAPGSRRSSAKSAPQAS